MCATEFAVDSFFSCCLYTNTLCTQPFHQPKTLAQALPGGWRVCEDLPDVDEQLVGQEILLKWNVVGWSHGLISRKRPKKKAAKFNFEVTYEPGELIYPHKLGLDPFRPIFLGPLTGKNIPCRPGPNSCILIAGVLLQCHVCTLNSMTENE